MFYCFIDLSIFSECASNEELDDFREEIKLMKMIGYHRNIVNLVGCSTIKKPLCLIVEYMPYGDLLHFLRQRRSKVNISTIFLYTVFSLLLKFLLIITKKWQETSFSSANYALDLLGIAEINQWGIFLAVVNLTIRAA